MSGSILPAAFAAQAIAKPASNNPLTQTDPDFAAIEDYLLKSEMPNGIYYAFAPRFLNTRTAIS